MALVMRECPLVTMWLQYRLAKKQMSGCSKISFKQSLSNHNYDNWPFRWRASYHRSQIFQIIIRASVDQIAKRINCYSFRLTFDNYAQFMISAFEFVSFQISKMNFGLAVFVF